MSAPIAERDRPGPPASWLDGLNSVGPAQIVPFLYEAVGRRTDLLGLRLLMADLDEFTLESDDILRAGITPTASSIPVVGSPQGEAYLSGAPRTIEAGGNIVVMVPVSTARDGGSS